MKKGFIGAIGDDFPSLIPLFFGVILFFSSIGYAFTTINERNSYINTYVDSLKIAKTALGKGTISNFNDFKSNSEKIISTSNFIAGIVYRENSELNPNQDYSDSLEIIEKENTFVCENNEFFILKESDLPKYTLKVNGENNLTTIGRCSEDYNIYYAASPSAEELLENELSLSDLARYHKIFNYIYPIGLMTPKGVVPAFLVVIVW